MGIDVPPQVDPAHSWVTVPTASPNCNELAVSASHSATIPVATSHDKSSSCTVRERLAAPTPTCGVRPSHLDPAVPVQQAARPAPIGKTVVEGPAIVKRGTSLNSHASLDASLNSVMTSISQTKTFASKAVPQQLTRQARGGAPEIVPEGPLFTRRLVQSAY